MIVRNITKNTIYAEDIDLHLPYQDHNTEVIDADTLKKSKCLRGFIINGMLEIVSHDPQERIEASVVYLKNKHLENSIKINKNLEIEEVCDPLPESVKLESSNNDIEVKINGIFYEAGGYGKVNRNFALKLHEAGIKVKVVAKRTKNQLRESELADIVKLTKTEISRNHICIDSVIPSFAEYSTGAYRILYTTIESYTIPKQFLESCQMYEEIWITSNWSMEILRKHIDKPIYVIPAGIDHELYTENGPRFNFKPNIKDFVFISVFGWSYRKGYDVLLRSYFEEFDALDNVSLLIVSRYQSQSTRFHRNKIKEDIDEIMKEFPNKDMPHVVRYSHIIPELQMPQLYRSADCFILPTRGEGSCCVPGTPIVTDKGIRNIEEISIDELVLTHKSRFKKVQKTFKREINSSCIYIYAEMNKYVPIRITENHPVLTFSEKQLPFHINNCEWKEAQDIKLSDYVVFPEDFCTEENIKCLRSIGHVRQDKYLFLKIKKIERRKHKGTVYNLEVEEDNSYATNAFIVHNCLTAPEASLCGLPVIMTNVSGQQQYLREDNAFLIEMDRLAEMRPGQMYLHYWDGQKFPALISPEVKDQIKKSMRYVVNNIDKAKQRNKKMQKLILEDFTWNNTANAAVKRLKEIKKGLS